MRNEQFLLLATKILANEATAEEKDLYELAQKLNPHLKEAADAYEKHWRQKQELPDKYDVDAALHKTWSKINDTELYRLTQNSAGNRFRIFTRIAAAAILVAVAAIAFYYYSPVIYKELVTTYGETKEVLLADGTQVKLAPKSKIIYAASFTGKERVVQLEGEAFFDVKKDSTRPFLVETPAGTVRVLGTSFNVNAYPEDNTVTTAVKTGKVAFISPSMQDSVHLVPGSKSVYAKSDKKIVKLLTEDNNEWAWLDGKLIFQSATLADIAATLSRYYGKPVHFKDAKFETYRYTGTFTGEPLETILERLSKIKIFPYFINDKTVTIGK